VVVGLELAGSNPSLDPGAAQEVEKFYLFTF